MHSTDGQPLSRDGHPGIKANLKATQGDLFLLEKYVFFVSKQPSLIEIADIHQVIFSRVGASMGAAAARTFDMKIVTKSGPEHNFSSINKEDHEPVESYLKDKKVRVKNEMIPDADLLLAAAAGDDDDDDMQSVSSDDGPPRIKASRGADDEDSSEDGAFHASLFFVYSWFLQRTSKLLGQTLVPPVIVILRMRVLQQLRMLVETEH
jgi:structure-specific recognition protein 1